MRISDIAAREAFGTLAESLERKGATCYFSEKDPRDNVLWADTVIKNPAVSTTLPQLSLAKRIETDFSFLFSTEDIKQTKLICVTGTKGKSTTVSAITHALLALGKEAVYCGNIGISAFTILNDFTQRKEKGIRLPEYVVCELSSWQIYDAYVALNGAFPQIELAVFTSIYADHQNSYSSVSAYIDDKLKLFGPQCRHILVKDSILNYFIHHTTGLKKKTEVFPSFYNPYTDHKLELQCAYDALKILGFKKKQITKALDTYKGMSHRIEQVAVIDDIMFINDSAATISQAVTFSMNNIMPLPVHLICGGTDKELSPNGMEKALKKASSITLLDGSFTRNKLIPLIEKNNFPYSGPYKTMEEAFNAAHAEAKKAKEESGKTQVVLLSPGAASFEYFKNEFDRGDQFKALVNKAREEKSKSYKT